jgi:hypothetical protein
MRNSYVFVLLFATLIAFWGWVLFLVKGGM